MTLEAAIRRLAETGELKHLLLTRSGQKWQASFGLGGNSYRVDIRDDPIDAVLVALGVVPVLGMNARHQAAPPPAASGIFD